MLIDFSITYKEDKDDSFCTSYNTKASNPTLALSNFDKDRPNGYFMAMIVSKERAWDNREGKGESGNGYFRD